MGVRPKPSQYQNPGDFLSRLTEAERSARTPRSESRTFFSDIVTSGGALAGGGEHSVRAPPHYDTRHRS
jgi:hypothetical protein